MKVESTIVVCGPVDAGKSSLIGVLTGGLLDDGRGLARNRILVHPHERETGRTSHISFNPILYNYTDRLIIKNIKDEVIANIDGDKVHDEKTISFVDLAGHEKYLKTTIFGVTGLFPDYGIVVIGANTGITKLTREHIGILLYLGIPFMVVITKIDLAPEQIYKSLCIQIKRLLSANTKGRILSFINDDNDASQFMQKGINNFDIIPIISISNKSGKNIDNLHRILYSLPPRKKWDNEKGTVYYIDSTFMVPGIGLILSGTNKGEPIKTKQKLYMGPFNGQFKEVYVKSIHNSMRQDVLTTMSGSQSCLAIRFTDSKDEVKRKFIRKGMVLIDNPALFKNNIKKQFKAEINVLHHSTTMRRGYAPIIHCGPIRQAAKLLLDESTILRSGDRHMVEFEFLFNQEFIEDGMVFFFRDGATKGVGTIINSLSQQASYL